MPMLGGQRFSQVGTNGKVDIQGVVAGSYVLISAMSDRGRSYSGRLEIDVSDRDVTDIVLPLSPGLELAGEVRVEDDAPIKFETLRVNLRGANTSTLSTSMGGAGPTQFSFGTGANEKVGEDGKFVLRDLFPDASRPMVSPLPDGFYVKSIRLGEQEVLESGLDSSRGAAGPLRITLSSKAGTVGGSVADDDGNPVTGATVVLIPKKEKRRGVAQFYKSSSTDQRGQFTIKNVEPGDYRVFAWEDVDNGAWMDAEFVKRVESKGADLTVDPGGRPALQLKKIPAAK